ncbi:Sec-independent protein translocase subunit TatA [Methylomarinum sp. Ch1-1]|uniref:Sec-independent protein translocase protein TatA n=1 Tax=Methylomarinum roseum TaxID=3067653 RepID=A0AAU7NX05_9GAMM|nr:Sec-independent protein translocase subunit TatA [Methylomarinum sp. Ch1-1]MDP4522477.1 Sec-independent protein translocase subunit TatA [Methylomarinum sp. Ch1-1]
MGISVTQLLIILAIVVVLFGTKRLKNIGADLGGAIKGFKGAMKDGAEDKKNITENDGETLEGEVSSKEKDKV